MLSFFHCWIVIVIAEPAGNARISDVKLISLQDRYCAPASPAVFHHAPVAVRFSILISFGVSQEHGGSIAM